MNRSKHLVLGTISSDAFVMVNKKLSKRIGFIEAGLLGELIATFRYAEQESKFFENGDKGEWFYLTQASIEERLGIKRREHDTAIKNLVKSDVIKKERFGLPAKTYYIILWENIETILYEKEPEKASEPLIQSDCTNRTNKNVQNVQTRMDESYKQDCTKRTTIKKNLKKQDIKTNNNYFVNKENDIPLENMSFRDYLLDIANKHYGEFASGRWSKKQWSTLTRTFISEILAEGRKIENHEAYIYGALKNIARSHDLKDGKVTFTERNSKVVLYNWLED